MKIILDTNFLIAALEYKINVFERLRGHYLYVTSSVKKELEKISEGSGSDAKYAKIALVVLSAEKIKTLRDKGSADASLLEFSKKGYAIATQDKGLRYRIKKADGKIILIRQKKKIEFH
jgi:rRNA-processing protein FCF1